MPVRKVSGGYKWGKSGKVYPTKAQAERQGRAIYASGYQDGGITEVSQGDDPSTAERVMNFMGNIRFPSYYAESPPPETVYPRGIARGAAQLQQQESTESPVTPARLAWFLSQLRPSAGITDLLEMEPGLPSAEAGAGEFMSAKPMPGMTSNIREGRYLDALLQGVGAAGDVAYATAPFTGPLGIAGGAGLKGIAALGKGLLMFPMSGMTTWHGSPHRFDQFRSSQIGTGEGAQSFGHGLYFSENPKTARTYSADRSYVGRAMAGDADNAEWDAARIAQTAMDEFDDEAVDHLRNVLRQRSTAPHQIVENKKVQDAIGMIQRGQVTRAGALYEVDIPDEAIAKMLDWDAPIREQAGITELFDEVRLPGQGTLGGDAVQLHGKGVLKGVIVDGVDLSDDGAGLYYGLSQVLDGEKVASEALGAAGIPGIRYLDAGSRVGTDAQRLINAQGSREAALSLAKRRLDSIQFGDFQGKAHWSNLVDDLSKETTRNFVVFDEDLPKIIGVE